jgi:hypothetical protein
MIDVLNAVEDEDVDEQEEGSRRPHPRHDPSGAFIASA